MLTVTAKKSLFRIIRLDPWILIFALYTSQIVGVSAVAWLLKLKLEEMLIPGLILVLGAATAPIFSRNPAAGRGNSWRRWVPSIIYAFFIASLSAQSFADVSTSMNTDYFHPAEFFTFGILLGWSVYPTLARKGRFAFAWRVILAGALFGMADEIHQAFVPGRDPNPIDLALDILGVSFACALFLLLSDPTTDLDGKPRSDRAPV